MFQHVMPRSSLATYAWPSPWRSTPRPTTKPSSMPLPGYTTSSIRPEWLPVATELATDTPKMILDGVLPGQNGAPGRIRTRDPLLRSMFHAAGQPAHAQIGGRLRCPWVPPVTAGFRPFWHGRGTQADQAWAAGSASPSGDPTRTTFPSGSVSRASRIPHGQSSATAPAGMISSTSST